MVTEPIGRLAYSPQEVADTLGICLNSVYALIKSGRLRAVKLPRRLLIPAKSVQDFLSQTADQTVRWDRDTLTVRANEHPAKVDRDVIGTK